MEPQEGVDEGLEADQQQLDKDSDSASAYEGSSGIDEDEQGSSIDEEDISAHHSSTAQSEQSRHTPAQLHLDAEQSVSDAAGGREESPSGSIAPYSDEQIREDAQRWAAGFTAPEAVKSPTRHAFDSRAKKRKAVSATDARVKRLKGFYSNEYRELLNSEIHDAASRTIKEDQILVEKSQIGSSLWTLEEKNLFFSCLSRLGRDDVRGIANRIQSKSELEIQVYIRLLHQALKEKRHDDNRQQLLGFTDYPMALQVSDECCTLLERAADALACRQEQYEEQVEEAKWGEFWLLTPGISRWIEKRRNEEDGEETMQKLLPAANLMNLKNWLTLSDKIFMNPAAPREEDNWQFLAEPGEKPAIRATAFEDFHSLAINFLKKVVSTTLFCTMSRLRAIESKKVKHAEVRDVDVAAALKIMGFSLNRDKFWTGCARRCNLEVLQDDRKGREGSCMTYEEVEMALSGEPTSTTLSQSDLRHEQELPMSEAILTSAEVSLEDSDSDLENFQDGESNEENPPGGEESDYYVSSRDMDDAEESLELSDSEFANLDSRHNRIVRRIKARKANERAQDNYTDAFDAEADKVEAQRLWSMLRQSSHFEIKTELEEMPERPNLNRNDADEVGDWRDNLEYWSQWETMERPVPEEIFKRPLSRMKTTSSKMEKGRAGTLSGQTLRSNVNLPDDDDELLYDAEEE